MEQLVAAGVLATSDPRCISRVREALQHCSLPLRSAAVRCHRDPDHCALIRVNVHAFCIFVSIV